LELEERLTKKTLYLEQQKETVKQIAYNKEENQKIIEIHEATHRRQVQKSNTVLQMELVKVTTKLEAKEEENQRLWEKANHPTYQTNNTVIGDGNTLSNQIIYQIQINQQFLQAELTNLKKDYQQTIESNSIPSNANQIKKTILFFTAKRMLANTRQETINKLIQTYQIATKSIQKYDKVTLVGNYLSYGEELAGAIPFGSTAVKIFSKGLPVIANLLKNNSLKQKANKFEEHLIEDERALTLLQATYQSLNNSLNQPSKINSLINNFLKSSNNELSKHGVFEVAKLEKNSSLKEENMTQAIELLTNHLKEFNQSLQSETKTCLEQLENLFASEHGQQLQGEIEKLLNKLIGKEKPEEEIANISSEKQILELEEKITTQKTQLENLINSIKDKLESKKKFTSANEKAKITQQRHQLLEQFIEKGFIDSALQKITEEKKINLAEITTLQASLQKLQEQLTNCQLENQIVINRN
jgi:hypothetical protein